MQRLGLIGGTGFKPRGKPDGLHQASGNFGQPSADFEEYRLNNLVLFFLPRHGAEHEIPPHAVNSRANIDAFRQLQVDGIVAINAVGGITGQNQPGTLCIPDQLIDYTWGRAHSFSMTADDALKHVEFAQPFEGRLRSALIEAAANTGLNVEDAGCIGVTQGPRLETAAEIQRMQRDGCDLVGMTSMPEAVLAREAGLGYASLCVVVNWATGLDIEPVSMEMIDRNLTAALDNVHKLLDHLFKDIANVG